MAQRKRNIEFAPPDEPSFLKKLKSQIGLQGNAIETVETKKSAPSKAQTSDLTDREDEQPVFVIADDSKISESELQAFQDKLKEDLEPINAEIDTSQKIIFKKPTKDKDSKGMQAVQSTKKDQTAAEKDSQSNAKKNIKSVKNASLLSFNADEEED